MELNVELPFRLLADVTFHYNEARFQYLFQVVRALAEFPVKTADIVVVTNTNDPEKRQKILSLCSPFFDIHPTRPFSKRTISVASYPGLSDPWHLPWCHKELIAKRFLGPESAYTHYIHLEDDIRLSFDNFCYFVRYRDILRQEGLIPTFLRVEFNSDDGHFYLADQIGVSDFASRKKVDIDNFSFVNPDYPHNAMFILDRDLASEYIRTRSFDRERSREVRPQWGLCERASMGLCFESPTAGFDTRYAVPVNPITQTTPSWCWVYHVPNNYTKNPRPRLGKTRTDQHFSPDPKVVRWSPPNLLENTVWHLKRLTRKMVHGPAPSTGHDLVPRRLCALCGIKAKDSDGCQNRSCPIKQLA
jgi:hypothetical protein